MTEFIESTDQAWEDGRLGRDEKYAQVARGASEKLDKALGLQMISIRLDKVLIDDLKLLAEIEGIGYQPLIRNVLNRFVDCEMKQRGRESAEVEKNSKATGLSNAMGDHPHSKTA